ncbi:hypothetical protein BGZ96_006209 [Linnemannia gamsii]|uniref:Arf-GAP domain-containing protein n=1 Tax=Linnemannia gamsii TaxID=64522 RepID=A0ABQ7KHR2_9FUNG|nr:hypothetical protein BGZ96_006209 [Linnemannia gamsii]
MATRSARTADKSTNDKHARILKALLQKSENKFCVDCRKKVKSIDLDSWTANQVESMIKWGNERVNKYWEARLPESSIPNENTSGIDPWIRSKYEWKQFTGKGPIPDPADLGPIDDAMLADLHGQLGARHRVHMNRSSESGSLGIIAPPPSTPTRPSSHKPTTPSSAGVQGGNLFSIGQLHRPKPVVPPQEDFFGLNEPASSGRSSIPATTQNQTQVNSNSKRTSDPPQQQQQSSAAASQDLFSMNTSPTTTPALSGNAANASSPAQAKVGNVDWKNSIMSLYGNQNSAGNRTSTGLSIGQQQQQQQQRPHSGQFSQGMNSYGYGQQQQSQPHQPNAFGFGQQHHQQQQQYHQPQHQQQQNVWGTNNNNEFGNMQQAAPSFGDGYNTGFGSQTQSNTYNNRPMSGNSGNNNNNNQAQGGDFFNLIASATKSPISSPPTQHNKSSSAFGDLSWN